MRNSTILLLLQMVCFAGVMTTTGTESMLLLVCQLVVLGAGFICMTIENKENDDE